MASSLPRSSLGFSSSSALPFMRRHPVWRGVMPAYYWMEFYVDPRLGSAASLVAETVRALLDAGCRYERVRLLTTQDTALDRMHQRVTREERALDLQRGQELATNSAARLEDSYPDAMLIFTYPFEFDPEVRAKISKRRRPSGGGQGDSCRLRPGGRPADRSPHHYQCHHVPRVRAHLRQARDPRAEHAANPANRGEYL